jgi:anti-anti-sigma factor
MATTYRVTRTNSNCNVAVSGALTAIVVPELKEALRKELQQETSELVFDLEETTMLDSSGIGLLIAASNSLSRTHGTIRVINPISEIYKLMSNMRLLSRLNVVAGRG